MAYLSDIEIAQQCEMKPIMEIAKRAHVDEKYVEQYGRYKAKIDPALMDETDRKLLLAFSLEGKPTRQIAEEMNMSDGQVRIRLHRIRGRLKKGMANDA